MSALREVQHLPAAPCSWHGPPCPGFGTLVISLDFELHWGVRDRVTATDPYRVNLLGAREAVPRILELFTQRGIAATWAVVGFLFAACREELESFRPYPPPRYLDARLSPYSEVVGGGEAEDPLHYAASLIELIAGTKAQEIGTHTYSHYYCLEPPSDPGAFAADLQSAIAIAGRRQIRMSSIVFPRNQHNPRYDQILLDAGITCYRGNLRRSDGRSDPFARARRLSDAYLPLARRTMAWHQVLQSNGLCNLPASIFLRPCSDSTSRIDKLRLWRVRQLLRRAAIGHEIAHIWWHPHNFGRDIDRNVRFLKQIIETFDVYRSRLRMKSMSMRDAAEHVRLPGHGTST